MQTESTSTGRGEGEMPWVLVRAGQGLYALSTRHVHEMVSTPPVSSVPHSGAAVRGLINLRGEVMPLVDLRVRFGLESQADATVELGKMLAAREQDHRRWVDELIACVQEKRPFTLTTDPHACAFGRWYDTFTTDNLLLDTLLKRFDTPHKRIHAIGQAVVNAMARGRCEECAALVNDGKTVLEGLVHLFEQTQAELRTSRREIAVVLKGAGPTCAVAVDAIESVERLPGGTMSPLQHGLVDARAAFVEGVAHRGRDGDLVLTLHADRLLP